MIKTQKKVNEANTVEKINMSQFWASWSSDSFIGAYNTRKLEFENWAKIRHCVGKICSFNH